MLKKISVTVIAAYLLLVGCLVYVPDTPTPQPISRQSTSTRTGKELVDNLYEIERADSADKEAEVKALLMLIVTSDEYDPAEEVLHKYVHEIDVNIYPGGILSFDVTVFPDTELDFIGLGAELIKAGAVVSRAGKADDWGLKRIEVNVLKGKLQLYVNSSEAIRQIVSGGVSVYDVMEFYGDDVEQ